MGQLERAGAPSAAAAFASAAIQHVDAALAGSGEPPGEGARREGRLWANLFEYALQGGAFQVSSLPVKHAEPFSLWANLFEYALQDGAFEVSLHFCSEAGSEPPIAEIVFHVQVWWCSKRAAARCRCHTQK